MNQIIDALIANLPLLLAVVSGLGVWHAAASLIRVAVAKAKDAAKGTKTEVDDIVVAVVGAQLEEVARLLDRGDIGEAKRRFGIVRSQAKPLVPPPGASRR